MAIALLALCVGGTTRPAAAGESFLDSNVKVREAVPYGRTSGEPPARPTGAAVPPRAQDEPQGESAPKRPPAPEPADDMR